MLFQFIFTLVGFYILFVTSNCRALPFFSNTNKSPPRQGSVPISHLTLHEGFGSQQALRLNFSRSLSRRETFEPKVQCVLLDKDLIKDFKGNKKLNEYADNHWSKGTRTILTYDEHYPDRKVELCTLAKEVVISYEGDPQSNCITNNVTVEGEFLGTSGLVSIAVLRGDIASWTYAVSSTTIERLSLSASLYLMFNGVAALIPQFVAAATISNTETKSSTITRNEMVTTTISMKAGDGQQCNAIQSVRSCVVQGRGIVPLVIKKTSTFWVEYEDKVKPKIPLEDGDTSSHYKYPLPADILEPDERSAYITIEGSLTIKSHVAYQGSCRNVSIAF
ncbi:hypothetical protein J3R30DRAFT_3462505 [Lentinula aciculospora]|uniref:Uncharacterized protein n=1 Tax=Lentinula aciculospora TaxID=153920 RepID=A0A9W9AHE8_9AGAR|nr:hypothetical protein J3R30DRAFT_3462505 [Lentinula aciculospora]